MGHRRLIFEGEIVTVLRDPLWSEALSSFNHRTKGSLAKMLLSAVCVLALASSAFGASVPTSAFGARVVKSQASSYNLAYTTGMAASRLHKDIVWMITSDYNEPY